MFFLCVAASSAAPPIEKRGGYNHMTCAACQLRPTIICWICMSICDKSIIYKHMQCCDLGTVHISQMRGAERTRLTVTPRQQPEDAGGNGRRVAVC